VLGLVTVGCASPSGTADGARTAANGPTTSSEPDGTTSTTTPAATATLSPTTTAENRIDDVILDHVGLIVEGVLFYVGLNDSEAEPVVAAVTRALGPATSDSGWGPHPIRYEVEYLSVRWVDLGLTLEFDDQRKPGDPAIRHFSIYSYGSYGTDPSGNFTVMDGITVGSTVREVIEAVGSYRPEVGLDRYQWAQTTLFGFCVIQAGDEQFGVLCFEPESVFDDPAADENFDDRTQPPDDAVIVLIAPGREREHPNLPCTYDGE